MTLEATDFDPLVGEVLPAGAAPLVLVEVIRHAVTPGSPRTQSFTLVFEETEVGHPGREQSVIEVDIPGVGPTPIFVVPRQPRPGGPPRYDAVFN